MRNKYKLLTFAILAFSSVKAQTTVSTPYCTAELSDNPSVYDVQINSVKFNGMTNNTGYATAPHYTFYSNLSAGPLQQGSSYSLLILPAGTGPYTLVAWIDFNRNNSFETAEKVAELINPPSLGFETFNVQVPPDASVGSTRMRVRIIKDAGWFNNASELGLPCMVTIGATTRNFEGGETEDYTIDISQDPNGNTTDITDQHNQVDELIVSPNPSTESFTLEISKSAKITVLDFSGKEYKQMYVNTTSMFYTVDWPKGIYYLKIETEGKSHIKKLIVE